MPRKTKALPLDPGAAVAISLPLRRGLRRPEAAGFIGVSEATFQNMVVAGAMPQPVKIGAASVWDVIELSAAFDRLKEPVPDSAATEWD